MNYADKIVAHVRKTLPYYIHNMEDFIIMDNGNGPYIMVWNPSFVVPRPSEGDINNITQEEYDNCIKVSNIKNNLDTKFETNVGNLDTNLTIFHLVGGIIYGEPIGMKTWTLPSSRDIVKFFSPGAFVGKTFSTSFTNMSAVKNVKIKLGEGMISRYKDIIINNANQSITLIFKIENINDGQESVSANKL